MLETYLTDLTGKQKRCRQTIWN